MTDSNQNVKTFTFEGDKYDMEKIPSEIKELITAINVADTKLKENEATLRLLAVARQTMAISLKQKLSGLEKIN